MISYAGFQKTITFVPIFSNYNYFLIVLLKVFFMNAENIGTWAGLVWNALNDAKKGLSLKDLRKATKLKVNEMHCALGWLAKEGKLNFAEGKDDIVVSLR